MELSQHAIGVFRSELQDMVNDPSLHLTIEAAWATLIASVNPKRKTRLDLGYDLINHNINRIMTVLKTAYLTDDSAEGQELVSSALVTVFVTIVLSARLPTPGFSSLWKDAKLGSMVPKFVRHCTHGARVLNNLVNDTTGIEVVLITRGTYWVGITPGGRMLTDRATPSKSGLERPRRPFPAPTDRPSELTLASLTHGWSFKGSVAPFHSARYPFDSHPFNERVRSNLLASNRRFRADGYGSPAWTRCRRWRAFRVFGC